MKQGNIVIIGDEEFNKLLDQRLSEHGESIHTFSVSEIEKDPSIMLEKVQQADIVMDTLSGPTNQKKELLKLLYDEVNKGIPLMSSILHHTATEMAGWVSAKNLIGFHPVQFDQLQCLEFAPSIQCDPKVIEKAKRFFQNQNKEIEMIQDQIGGVFPRTLAMLLNEAAYALGENIATAHGIDTAMKKGTNYPYGPLEWADEIGIDHIYYILVGLHRELGDDRYRPAPLLRKYIYAQHLGVKTSKGFYAYE